MEVRGLVHSEPGPEVFGKADFQPVVTLCVC